MRAAPLVGGMAFLSACGQSAKADVGSEALGPQKTVAWAVGTTGSDFVTEISVGAADAAEMLGWRFNRILNPLPTPDAHVAAIRNAVTSRADVILTVDWYQAVIEEIKAGQKEGVQFAVVNSASNLDELAPLNVPFVGHEPRSTGRMMGERIARTLAEQGITSGSVLVGNPFPGSVNVEERIRGIADGLAAGGGELTMATFPDSSATDSTLAVGLYKSKITELGDVVAHAVAGGEMSAIPLTKAVSELGGDAQKALIGSWVSSLKTLNLVKSGEIAFALDEGLYYQGFLAVLLAWSMLERKMPAVSMPSGTVWVSADNVDAVIESYNTRKAAAEAYGLS